MGETRNFSENLILRNSHSQAGLPRAFKASTDTDMKHLSLNSLLLIVSVCLSQSLATATDIPSNEELKTLGLRVHWNNQAVLNVRRDKIVHVTNDEENVYVQSSAGVLTVFHAENGQKRWVAQVGRLDEPAMPAVSNESTVLIITGPVAYGFNKFDGAPLFEFRLPQQPSAPPAIDETSFFVPLTGGAMYAYSLKVLEYQYRYNTLPDTVATPHLWRFICAEEIIHAPVIGELTVAFVTKAGSLHSVNTSGLERGRSRFQLLLNHPASAAPALGFGDKTSSVIMLTEDNQIFSIDIVKGTNEWTYPMGRAMTSAPIVINDDVLVVSDNGTLTKLSRNQLVPYWGRPVEIPGYVAPGYIGAAMISAEFDPVLQNALQLPLSQTLGITDVVPGSPAASAGLIPGDRIITIDDIPVASVEDAQNVLSQFPLRIERPVEVVSVSIGAEMEAVSLDLPIQIAPSASTARGIRLKTVIRNSPADISGLEADDIIVAMNDRAVNSIEELQLMLTEFAPGRVTVKALRKNIGIQRELTLSFVGDAKGRPTVSSAISVRRLGMRISVRNWDVNGIRSLTAVGRFGIYGIDVTNRLVAFDRYSAALKGRVPVSGYRVHHHNETTDFIYLASESGEIVCLKETGPVVVTPELSPSATMIRVAEISVEEGDAVEPAGTVLCTLELPDGTLQDIESHVKGVVDTVFVKKGMLVKVGTPLFQIAEDVFAVYHRRPGKRPVDIEPADPADIQSEGF